MKVDIYNLTIEVTRRCNLKCDHCLRGDAQNMDIDVSLVSRLFDQVERIDSLNLTGGEPSLVPHIISQIFDIAAEKDIEIGRFYIATNGMEVTRDFLDALFKAYIYCDGIDIEDECIKCLEISSDIQHQEAAYCISGEGIPKENIKKLLAFKFAGKRNEDHNYMTSNGTIWAGRAKDFYSFKGREEQVSRISLDEDNIIEELVLNCKGNILPDCDLSYKSQDNEEIIICNVGRKNFSLLNSIKRYNKHIVNGDIYNIKVA